MPVIELRSLVKHYRNVHALQGVSITVEKGEIYSLLGKNGAGKTTIVKILLSIVRATSGEAILLGRPAGHVESRRKVGYLPEDHRFPDYHTGWSALDYYAALSGVSGAERRSRIPEMLRLVGIEESGRRKIRTYSKGMKQRLGLAQAMIHEPDVLFLDEPTDGVDPVGRKQIRDVLVHLKSQGKTIFLNSHLLSEVELISDRVGILELGKLRREGTVAEMTVEKDIYELRLEGAFDALMPEIARRVRGVRRIAGGVEVDVENAEKLNALVDYLRANRVALVGMTRKRQSLEDVFIQEVGVAGQGA
ncbi:MAG: ABC transporter ATP-binding protein [Planctomycetes bacterium]|nr:ABC transporter ATP-binding protein [Planctomycetota bacterium]